MNEMQVQHTPSSKRSNSSSSVENTLHHALGPFLVISQPFGTLPVSGIWPGTNVGRVSFRYCSLAVPVTLILIGLSVSDFVVSMKVVVERGLKLYTVGPLSFSIICLACFIAFLKLAPNWPNLMRQTRRCEVIFLQDAYSSHESRHFSRRIRIFGSILMCAGVVEHLTYVSSAIYNNKEQIRECNLTVDFWKNYFQRERSQTFEIAPYTPWLIPLVEWTTIATTYIWNFIDIFLTLIFYGMAMRFRQVHARIRRHLGQHMPAELWQQVRQDYCALAELVALYDNKLSGLILVSCSSNLYFICAQVFHSFTNKGNFMNEIYFWVSLIFVLTRFLTMMFSAASVYDAANNIMSTMYEIPTEHWCSELQRLTEMIVSQSIAFSGKGFFFLTRRLIFAMIGTIIVYELVLIDQMEDAEQVLDFCSSKNV